MESLQLRACANFVLLAIFALVAVRTRRIGQASLPHVFEHILVLFASGIRDQGLPHLVVSTRERLTYEAKSEQRTKARETVRYGERATERRSESKRERESENERKRERARDRER